MRISDWSSDVCSSDLHLAEATTQQFELVHRIPGDRGSQCGPADDQHFKRQRLQYRPERTTRDHETAKDAHQQDRKSVEKGKSEPVRVDLGGRRSIKKNKKHEIKVNKQNRKKKK